MLFDRIPGRAYLLTAIIIFAAASAVTRKLTEIGANNLIDGRNPISFCNVLFVGNLCALIFLLLIYGKDLNRSAFKKLSFTDWLAIIGVAILAGALAPGLIFTALDITTVNNVVLIGRIEPPIVLGLSVLLLKEKVNIWIVSGAFISFVGVVLTVLLQEPENVENMMMEVMQSQVGLGEFLAAGGAIALAISTIISKVKLKAIPLSIFSIFRTAIGTVVFFLVVIILFEPSHFIDVFSPLLWQWMIFYSVVIVVGGQLSWFQGLKRTGAADVSLASSFSPIAGVLAAYFLLGEAPTTAQYIGGSVIIIGIVFNQIGVTKLAQNKAMPEVTEKEMDLELGYKGI
ncbi:MAG: DMT family transporter [Prochloraceae cyanobacterium]